MHMGLASGSDVAATHMARMRLMHAKTEQMRRRMSRRCHVAIHCKTSYCQPSARQHKDPRHTHTRSLSAMQDANTYARVHEQKRSDDRADANEELVGQVEARDDELAVELRDDVLEEVVTEVRERLLARVLLREVQDDHIRRAPADERTAEA